ncbi:hypothetical protein ACFSM5_17575 [Lacibacterium aquatile]|uniref:Tetratricopeptide repeat protein n=1 Tax=Lacibacterium aquatile TaxID=1168082 RepID=A0ABW5DY37_9PROT
MLAGVGLLALAVPRLMSGLATLEVNAGDASADHMAAAVRALNRATSLVPNGELMIERAALELRLGRPPSEIIPILQEALGHSLANPKGWALLASLLRSEGDVPGAVRALRLSFLTGPVVPELMAGRLELALSLLDGMNGEMLELTARQVRLAWKIDSKPIISLIQRPELTGFLTQALGTEQD